MDDRIEKLWTNALKAVGLTLVQSESLTVNCNGCGFGWHRLLQSGGKRPRRWWRCRNGCNAEVARPRAPSGHR